MSLPDLIAHRGYQKLYPENTLIGIAAAIAAGARYVEVDIQLSRDRVPVLFHDRKMRRICDVDGAIHQYTLDQLSKFRAFEFDRFGYKFAQNPITTLPDLVMQLQQHPEVTVFVELKRTSIKHFGISTMLHAILPLLQPVKQRCVLISYSLEALEAAYQQGWRQLGAVLDNWQQRKRSAMIMLKPRYLFVDTDTLPRWGRLQHPGAKLAVFEIDDPLQAIKLHKRGIDLIETFDIGKLQSHFDVLEQ